MASSKTGELNKEFLDSTNTVPSSTTYSANKTEDSGGYTGYSYASRSISNRPKKGNVTHVVTSPGTPVTAKASFTSSSEKSRGRRLENSI